MEVWLMVRYDVDQIPLTSDPMPAALLSNPMIWIPLSLLSRRWYILHYHRSTLLLTFRGEVVAVDGRVEERSEVIY